MKTGDRVRKVGYEYGGIVREVEYRDGEVQVQVHWGTDARGEVLEWVRGQDLEAATHQVVTIDEVLAREVMRAKRD